MQCQQEDALRSKLESHPSNRQLVAIEIWDIWGADPVNVKVHADLSSPGSLVVNTHTVVAALPTHKIRGNNCQNLSTLRFSPWEKQLWSASSIKWPLPWFSVMFQELNL
jgi:hypothetical protein